MGRLTSDIEFGTSRHLPTQSLISYFAADKISVGFGPIRALAAALLRLVGLYSVGLGCHSMSDNGYRCAQSI